MNCLAISPFFYINLTYLLHGGFLLGLFFNPEGGDHMLLRNIS
jgi:hypothetical protein